MAPDTSAVMTVAGLMELAARTAPKAKGVDTIVTRTLAGPEVAALAEHLKEAGTRREIGFFIRDAGNIAASEACVLIGADGRTVAGINCGACGFSTCGDLVKECKKRKRRVTDFAGPNCAVRMTDLGIALGSAVKTAQVHNVDNRIMYSGGTAAISLGLMGKACTVAYAIPLSATGKNIFFDREKR